MKLKLSLAAILFLIFVQPAGATFTFVQEAHNVCTTAATTCAVTVTALGAGHLIIIGGSESTNTVSLSSVTATGETFTVDTGCRSAGDAFTGGIDCAYTLSSAGGATTVTCNWSASTQADCDVREFSFTSGPVSKDASGTGALSGNCAFCTGTALTLTGANDVIQQGIACGDTCTAIDSSYVGVFLSNGNGWAYLANTTSGAAPTWTQTTAQHTQPNGIAFKESAGGGGVCKNFIALLGAGCK